MNPISPSSPEAAELGRVLEARVDQTLHDLESVTSSSRPGPESLHRLHRDLRRLRVGLGVWTRASSKGRQEALRAYDRRLKHLARLVGGVRDRDVALGLLAQAPADLPSRERRALRRLRVHLTDDARIGRELIRASLRTERDLGLFEGIRDGFRTLPSARRAQALGRYLEEVHQEGQEAVRLAHRKARRKPTSRRLHTLRIRVRSWRHLSDLAAAIDPSYGVAEARPLQSLQARLGRLHDLDVVEDLTADSAPPAWNRAIRKERRRQQDKVVRTLRSSHWREMVPTLAVPA
ncbi:MAG TPA: CHAD domain-containing protein [Thermoplasmata archaeon]|nr:CHAD domain-containing protein [Thermoplasmata archaeon]